MQDFMKSDKIRELRGWVLSLLTAVIAALFIRAFIIETVLVEGSSMFPPLHDNERVIMYKTGYMIGKPKRSDIVIFRTPNNPEISYIKRVIGLPGDKVPITDGRVYINGAPLHEAYVLEPAAEDFNEREIPEDMYFVLGDNRNNSMDSRYSAVGFVPLNSIKGKAVLRIWPLYKISVLR